MAFTRQPDFGAAGGAPRDAYGDVSSVFADDALCALVSFTQADVYILLDVLPGARKVCATMESALPALPPARAAKMVSNMSDISLKGASPLLVKGFSPLKFWYCCQFGPKAIVSRTLLVVAQTS